ncbi:MAG: hypothetical protein ABI639_16345 [Thermoanaerobaculia bacterium]
MTVKLQVSGLPAAMRPVGNLATPYWNDAGCNPQWDFPYFSTNPSSFDFTLVVNWQTTATGNCTQNQCGFFNNNTRQITLCSQSKTVSGTTFSCGTQPSNFTVYLAHEMGHFLGITHTPGSCPNACLMNAQPSLWPPTPEECQLADDQNFTYWEDHEPADPGCQAYCVSTCIGTHCPESPILVDLDADGFELTGLRDGVTFDIDGDGIPDRIGWTSSERRDVFLALDLDQNGAIDNGHELFGNFSTTPDGATPRTGFGVLQIYDEPQWGGNADGKIDRRDRIYPSLLAWLDQNHNGTSEPGELHGMAEIGILQLETGYFHREVVDGNGNLMFYWSSAVVRGGDGRLSRVPTLDALFVNEP